MMNQSLTRTLNNFVIVDPAKTVKLHSADSAIVGIGLSKELPGIFVRDIVSGKLYPDELYKESLAMCERLSATVLAVEVTGLNEFITQPFENAIRRAGTMVRFLSLQAKGKKEERIAQLAPYYRQGLIYHNKRVCTKLETQLLSFPRSKLLDVMDALAYVIELMHLEGDFFDPFDLGVLPLEDEGDDLPNEEAYRIEGWLSPLERRAGW
jgi:hypothetical protein